MGEKDKLFESKIKSSGIFDFAEFYKFCYDWLTEETELNIFSEDKYVEKLSGDSKNIDIEWTGKRKVTDYFRFEMKVKFRIIGLKKIEITRDGRKQKTNEGSVEVSIKSSLERDYEGKYETGPFKRFLRGVYDKWIIPGRIDQMEDKLVGDSNEFLEEAKAFLALEGKK